MQRPARAAQFSSGGAQLDSRHIDGLSARDERTDIAILRDAGQRFQPISEGNDLMAALFDEQRHGPLNRAAWIDQHNSHGVLSGFPKLGPPS